MQKHIVMIDGGYMLHYRFHAAVLWWKRAKETDPRTDPQFLTEFRRLFADKTKEICRKLHKAASGQKALDPSNTIIAFDCRLKDVWRRRLFAEYKGTRGTTPGPINELYGGDGGVASILTDQPPWCAVWQHPNLEADDCIAIGAQAIQARNDGTRVTIVTSDTDYLQLASPSISIVTCKLTPVASTKNSTGDPRLDLAVKILRGDKSDNIPSVFKGCGPKTALRLAMHAEELNAKLADPAVNEVYARNKTLIDFTEIPPALRDGFSAQVDLTT